jgi:hypothetical protein
MSSAPAPAQPAATDPLLLALREGKLYRPAGASADGKRVLIVFVHGASRERRRERAAGSWSFWGLLGRLVAEKGPPFGRADLLPFNYENTFYTRTSLDDHAEELRDRIQKEYDTGAYDDVYILAHSAGTLIARRAAVLSFDRGPSGWHTALRRLVLLANANRGFALVRGRATLVQRATLAAVDFLGLRRFFGWAGVGRLPLQVSRGSPWVRDLRLGWQRRFERTNVPSPAVAQVVGDRDELVGDDDLQETYQFSNHCLIKVRDFSHETFKKFPPPDGTPLPADLAAGYRAIVEAFTRAPTLIARPTSPSPRRAIVFLVHGIRDFADWQENVSYFLRKTFAGVSPGGEVEVVPVRYGYFSAFQFLFPSQRERSVRAFTDAYFQVLSRFPDIDPDDIHVLAHSNGSFVVGTALRDHKEIKVNRVVVAGSVLPRDFDWPALLAREQLKHVHSVCGNTDWPVGWLCRGLSLIPWIGLGTGGYGGFKRTGGTPPCVENNHLEGGHGAGVATGRHEDLAKHLLGVAPLEVKNTPRKWWFQTLHLLLVGWVPVAVVLVGLGLAALSALPNVWGVLGAFALAVLLIYVLSKV